MPNMLSVDFIRENKEKVALAAKNKNRTVDIDAILTLDDSRKTCIQQIQKLREERNTLASAKGDEKAHERGREIKDDLKKLESELSELEAKLNISLMELPNISADDVPVGQTEEQNEVVRKNGTVPSFDFEPKDHLTLGEALDILDVKRAAKVSGARFTYLKNEAVMLEFALIQLALTELTKEGFTPVIPPTHIKKEITEKLGYWHAGGNEDYYWVKEPEEESKGLYLIGTAEHSIVPLHQDEILDVKELPKRYIAFSSCFRREAGTYGKDTRGILRLHQFDKLEMVSFTTPEKGDGEHEFLLSLEERLFQLLEVPYQVVKMCTGDLGFPAARKYDISAWIPSQKKYREVTSTSTTTDFQSRRLNIKYRDGESTQYVHILNGTAFAIGRTLIAIIENNQQKDGSIKIPDVLVKYTGFEFIK